MMSKMSREVTVVVPWFGSDPSRQAAIDWVVDRWDALFGFRIVFGDGESRSIARNRAADQVDTKYMILADADTTFDPAGIEEAYELMDNEATWVVPYSKLKYYALTKEFTQNLLTTHPGDSITNQVKSEFAMTSWSGLQMVRTNDYWKIGGYDERFTGWGWEDLAFRVQMDAEFGFHVRSIGRALHLWHERGDNKTGTPEELANEQLFKTQYSMVYNWRDERVR